MKQVLSFSAVIIALPALQALATADAAAVQDKSDAKLAAIAKAWQARQDRVRSARFAWTTRQVVPKGFISGLITGLSQPFVNGRSVEPAAVSW
jgi:hypothetical protein